MLQIPTTSGNYSDQLIDLLFLTLNNRHNAIPPCWSDTKRNKYKKSKTVADSTRHTQTKKKQKTKLHK